MPLSFTLHIWMTPLDRGKYHMHTTSSRTRNLVSEASYDGLGDYSLLCSHMQHPCLIIVLVRQQHNLQEEMMMVMYGVGWLSCSWVEGRC